MKTEVLTVDPVAGFAEVCARAGAALARGELVVFPTETVYGVAANAAMADSVNRLRDVKGRASTQPFTVHVGRRGDVERFVPRMSPVARRLMEKGWPGPLTLLFKIDDPRKSPVYSSLPPEGSEAVFGGGSVGVRFPDDPIAAPLLAAADVPVIASSANRSGRPAPITADEARAELDGKVDLIIDAGRARYGRPSTIVSLNGTRYSILRVGVFDERTIRRIAGFTILFVCSGNTCRSPMAAALARMMLARQLECSPRELELRGVSILSAGTQAHSGAPATPDAVAVVSRRGADLADHRSGGLTQETIRSADRIFVMTRSHMDCIRELVPAAATRMTLLDSAGDIPDPLGGPSEGYDTCAARIEAALEKQLKELPI